ncbi:somatostatin receptor type 5-like [Branchiostoma lanceolatum]|uniref:somatostatin receptor type 5-like n=1 Tax=Branchiostoma lanceolatum TaxID=7740 RepID=UPI0034557696
MEGVGHYTGVMTGNGSAVNGTDDSLETLLLASDIITTIVAPTVYSVESAAALLGNALVIYMLLGFTKMKDATHYYILNLALADTLFMLGVPFISVSSAMEQWVFGKAMCKIVLSMDAMSMFNSVFTLAVLSVDRYLAIVYSTSHAHLRRPKVAIAVSLSVLAASILLTIPVMTVSDTVQLEDGTYICFLNWPVDEAMFWHKVITSYTFVVGFVLPLAVISVSYLLVVRHLKASASEHAAVARVSVKVRTKVTKTVTAMIVTFAACWLPFHMCQLIVLAAELRPTLWTLVMFHLAVVMSYANSCINPILYVFMSQKFRQSFRAALRLSWRRNADRRANQRYVRRRDGIAGSRQDMDGFLEEEKCEANLTILPYSVPRGNVYLRETTV